MSPIQWRDSFNTGVAQFDEEHRTIVELIQKLFEAVRKNQDGNFEEIIEELIEYTEYHFANEERAMAKAGYAMLEEHKKAHEKLAMQATTFREISSKMTQKQVQEFYHFLRKWLIDHIMFCDKKYGNSIT